MKRLALSLVLLISALLRVAHADDWTLTLKDEKGVLKATSTMGSAQSITKAQSLKIICTAPVDCGDVAVKVGDKTVAPLAADKQSATVNIEAEPATVSVLYKQDPRPLFNISVSVPGKVTTSGAVAVGGGNTGTGEPTLAQMLSTQCHFEGTLGPREVVVSPLGSPLSALPDRFAENETLTVTVLADARLLPLLSVKRTSGIRVVTGLKILGADTQFSGLIRQAAREATCDTRQFPLSDFSAGTGEVEISIRIGETTTALGGFQFLVDPVYWGMFSLGAIWTPLVSPDFTVATRGGQEVIVQTETGTRRLAYSLLITPFLWDGLERDVRKSISAKQFYRHVNPSIGFVLNDPLDNVLAGLTLDFGAALLITGGAIFTNVKTLDGVVPGQAFMGTADQLPTQKHWTYDWFFGVSLDLRAAVQLLRAVLGTGAP